MKKEIEDVVGLETKDAILASAKEVCPAAAMHIDLHARASTPAQLL